MSDFGRLGLYENFHLLGRSKWPDRSEFDVEQQLDIYFGVIWNFCEYFSCQHSDIQYSGQVKHNFILFKLNCGNRCFFPATLSVSKLQHKMLHDVEAFIVCSLAIWLDWLYKVFFLIEMLQHEKKMLSSINCWSLSVGRGDSLKTKLKIEQDKFENKNEKKNRTVVGEC